MVETKRLLRRIALMLCLPPVVSISYYCLRCYWSTVWTNLHVELNTSATQTPLSGKRKNSASSELTSRKKKGSSSGSKRKGKEKKTTTTKKSTNVEPKPPFASPPSVSRNDNSAVRSAKDEHSSNLTIAQISRYLDDSYEYGLALPRTTSLFAAHNFVIYSFVRVRWL